jgi:hypothetical protein
MVTPSPGKPSARSDERRVSAAIKMNCQPLGKGSPSAMVSGSISSMAATLLTEAMLQISVRMLLVEGVSTKGASSSIISINESYHSLVIQ